MPSAPVPASPASPPPPSPPPSASASPACAAAYDSPPPPPASPPPPSPPPSAPTSSAGGSIGSWIQPALRPSNEPKPAAADGTVVQRALWPEETPKPTPTETPEATQEETPKEMPEEDAEETAEETAEEAAEQTVPSQQEAADTARPTGDAPLAEGTLTLAAQQQGVNCGQQEGAEDSTAAAADALAAAPALHLCEVGPGSPPFAQVREP